MFHILNPLPDLLIYGNLGPLILRLAIGYFFIIFAIAKFKDPKWKILGFVELILGLCFIIGLEVQIDSILAILFLLGPVGAYERMNIPEKESRSIYWLLLVIAISLLLTGAGLPAIDLPL